MSEKTALSIKNRAIKIYGVTALVFIAIFGFITAFAVFMSRLN